MNTNNFLSGKGVVGPVSNGDPVHILNGNIKKTKTIEPNAGNVPTTCCDLYKIKINKRVFD